MKTLANAAAGAMRTGTLALLLVVFLVGVGRAAPQFVRLDTGEGPILLVMYPAVAPHHVGNFTHLASTGFYDGSSFHRIVPGFVIQGGDPNSKDDDPRNDGMGGPTISDVLTPEELEQVDAVNALLASKGYVGIAAMANLKAEFSPTRHLKGTLSMARSREPDSAGSQFFICVDVTTQLDNNYTVFGHVVMGTDVADRIVSAEKNTAAGRDAPAVPVVINKATVLEGVDGLTADEQAAWNELPAGFKPQGT